MTGYVKSFDSNNTMLFNDTGKKLLKPTAQYGER